MADNAKPDRNVRSDGPKATNAAPAWAGMASVGFEFVLAILLPGALGWWLDGRLGWRPWLMLAGGLLGFVAGLTILMRAVRNIR